MGMFLPESWTLFARIRTGRMLEKLWEGDPVAWTILGAVVVATIVWAVIKARYLGGDE